MKIWGVVKKIGVVVVFAGMVGMVLLQEDFSIHIAEAYQTTCPYTDPYECLEYFENQMGDISNEKNDLENAIAAEDFEQLGLYEQISYLESSIRETELNISELEITINKNNIEINLLGEQIVELQNSIDTLLQEINLLEATMAKRTVTSYKMSLMSPVEVILESQDLETMMRRMKYMLEVKKKDRELLIDMNTSRKLLQDDEEVLAEKRAEVQEKRNETEEKRADLATERNSLTSQKNQQNILLAESQMREQSYRNNIAELQEIENSVTKQISALIAALYKSGQIPANTRVNAGDPIGFQGHTGYSYGSHLHFELDFGYTNPFANGYLTGGSLGGIVGSGSVYAPISGGVLTQTFHYSGRGPYAIDISGTSGGGSYWKGMNSTCCYGFCFPSPSYVNNPANQHCIPNKGCYFSLVGEGSPVRALKDGWVTDVLVDQCGGKYSIVDYSANKDGSETSLYLHLK